jgi:hypothetical protein
MALLDMQGMVSSDEWGGCDHGSDVSLLLCDSAASVTLCL